MLLAGVRSVLYTINSLTALIDCIVSMVFKSNEQGFLNFYFAHEHSSQVPLWVFVG